MKSSLGESLVHRNNRFGYWFAFHPSQQTALLKYAKAWIAFGCGSEKQILFVPLPDFLEWLSRMNKTELEERFYWHVHIAKEGESFRLETKRGCDDVDLTAFLLKRTAQDIASNCTAVVILT